jgi:acetyl-CoA C-acetyltransferase
MQDSSYQTDISYSEKFMSDTEGRIHVENNNRITTITIDRPDKHNALTPELHQGLANAFDEFAADADQWVAVITGAGERAFSAGSDLKRVEVAEMIRGMPWSGGYGGIVSRFDLNKPVIAAVNGFALGGGFEIALACDLIIASDKASFGLPEPRAGVAAVGGGLHRLPRQIGLKKAMGIILSGERVSAAQGEKMGFVNEVVPADQLIPTAHKWAQTIMLNSPIAIQASKDAVHRGLQESSLEEALINQPGYPGLESMWASEDYKEGPRAFAEKRQPNWQNK